MAEKIAVWAYGEVKNEVLKLLTSKGIEPLLVQLNYDYKHEPYFEVLDGESSDSECLQLCQIDKVFFYVPLTLGIVELTQTFIKAAAEWGVRHLVGISDYDTNGPLKIVRQQIQSVLDSLLVNSGISYTILRSNFIPFSEDWIDDGLNSPSSDGFITYHSADGMAQIAVNTLLSTDRLDCVYDVLGPTISFKR